MSYDSVILSNGLASRDGTVDAELDTGDGRSYLDYFLGLLVGSRLDTGAGPEVLVVLYWAAPRRVDEDLMEQFLTKLRNIAGRTPEKIEAFDRTASQRYQRLRNWNRISSKAESHRHQ